MKNPTLTLNKDAAEQDERFARSANPEVRGDRGAEQDAARTQDGGLTHDEFQNFLETESLGTRLPRPPGIPGWHLCWLSTTSQYDTIQNRMRFGYTPVRRSELEGFDPSMGQELVGQEGNVTCNEMVLFKIRDERYRQMMVYFHHQQPLENETAIVTQINNRGKDSAGRQLVTTDGDGDIDGIMDMEATARTDARRAPTFAE